MSHIKQEEVKSCYEKKRTRHPRIGRAFGADTQSFKKSRAFGADPVPCPVPTGTLETPETPGKKTILED